MEIRGYFTIKKALLLDFQRGLNGTLKLRILERFFNLVLIHYFCE